MNGFDDSAFAALLRADEEKRRGVLFAATPALSIGCEKLARFASPKQAGVGQEVPAPSGSTIYLALSALSAGASAFHGYKRNHSVGWGVWWGLMGGIFPIITPAIALAQGFGKRER